MVAFWELQSCLLAVILICAHEASAKATKGTPQVLNG